MSMNNELLVSAQALCLSISVTASASTSAALPDKGGTLRVVNEGGTTAYISVGAGTQTATVPGSTAVNTCTPILASSDVSLRIDPSQLLNISAIAASGTTTLRVQVSEGV